MVSSVMPAPLLIKLRATIASLELRPYHALMAVLLCNVMYLGYYIAYGLIIDAKFWHDELFTVGNALRTLPEMLHLVLGDNHPPLYPVFIHFWMQLVPNEEFAARFPSIIFGLGSVWAIWQLRKTSLPPVMVMITLILLTSNYMWAYYALEARGYGLLLFLTTVTMVFYLRQKLVSLVLVGILMGLVHFFGALAASLFFAVVFFTPKQSLRIRITAAIAQVIISIYPFYHLFFGSASVQIGGKFWLKEGPIDTVINGFSTSFPWFGQSIPAVLVAFGLEPVTKLDTPAGDVMLANGLSIGFGIVIFLFLIRGYQLFRENYACIDRVMQRQLIVLGAMLLTTISLIAILSLHTPMGSVRNFIVLAPIGSLLGAWFIYTFFVGSRINSAVGIVALALISVTSAGATSYTLSVRWGKNTDLERWSVALYNQVATTTGKLHYIPVPPHLFAPRLSEGEKAIYNYYMPEQIEIIPIKQEQILDLPRGSAVGFWSSECIEFNEEHINHSINSVTLYLDENDVDYTYHPLGAQTHCATGYVVLN